MIAHTVRCLYSSFVLLLSFMLLSNCGTTPVAQQPPTVETAPEDATMVPTIQPTTDDAALSPVPDAPTAPVAGEAPAEDELAYYWPATLPSGLAVNPNRVSISEQFYAMDTTIAEGRVLTLRGSTGTPTPNFSSEPEAIHTNGTVRGQTGIFISAGVWNAITWEQADWGYTIYGLNIPSDELLAIAEDLEPLSQPAWEERLAALADQDASELIYFWPDYLPSDFEVTHRQANVSVDGFSIVSSDVHDKDRTLMLLGGAGATGLDAAIKPTSELQTILVRDQPGLLVGSEPPYMLVWDEQGHRYSIRGDVPEEELLAVVEGLMVVKTDWKGRRTGLLGPTVAPTDALGYLWPSQLPEGWSVQLDQSQADEQAFTLTVADPTNPQMVVTLQGGVGAPTVEELSAPPQETLEIRGNEAFFFTTGGGGQYRWRENGNPYALDGFVTSEMLALFDETLETLDLATWQERLASVE